MTEMLSSFRHQLTVIAMSKVCTKCGFSAPIPEPPVPPKGAGTLPEVEEPSKCLNCGEAGTMEEVVDLPSGEDEQE
jgi:hypothetical protein